MPKQASQFQYRITFVDSVGICHEKVYYRKATAKAVLKVLKLTRLAVKFETISRKKVKDK